MINLDVVTGWLLVTCRYNEIHILMMLCVTQHFTCFTTQVGTYRETFRRRLTADSRLRIAMDSGRGSLVKICGLTQIKISQSAHLYWPTRRWHENGRPHPCPVLPANHEALPCYFCRCRCLGVPWCCLRLTSLPVAKTDVQRLPTTVESWENSGRQQCSAVSIHMLLHQVSRLHSDAATAPR